MGTSIESLSENQLFDSAVLEWESWNRISRRIIALEEEGDKNEATKKEQPLKKKVKHVNSWIPKDIQDTNRLSD